MGRVLRRLRPAMMENHRYGPGTENPPHRGKILLRRDQVNWIRDSVWVRLAYLLFTANLKGGG